MRVRAYEDAGATVIQRFDGQLPSISGMGCWSILAIPRRMRTTPSVPCAPGSRCRGHGPLKRPPEHERQNGWPCGWAFTPVWWSWGRWQRGTARTPGPRGHAESGGTAARAGGSRYGGDQRRHLAPGSRAMSGVKSWSCSRSRGWTCRCPYIRCRARQGPGRLEVAAPHGWTPLVGREVEVALLRERWRRLYMGWAGGGAQRRGGHWQIRLVQALKEHVAEDPHTMLECRASPYHQHSAPYPVIHLLQRLWQSAPGETPA